MNDPHRPRGKYTGPVVGIWWVAVAFMLVFWILIAIWAF
jgi:hypothetical protein